MKKLLIITLVLFMVSLGVNIYLFCQQSADIFISKAQFINCESPNVNGKLVCTGLSFNNKWFNFTFEFPKYGGEISDTPEVSA